jgi:hypothetical protein
VDVRVNQPNPSEKVDVEALYIEVEGDKHKVEPTRKFFAAIYAGLKTAEEYGRELALENERLQAELEAAREREKALGEVLRRVFGAFCVADQGDPWYCEHEGIDVTPIYAAANEALAKLDAPGEEG